MRVLAVDTTTPRGSIAIVAEEGVLAEVRVRAASGHSGWVLPAVDMLLGGLSLRCTDLGALAVTIGPGSFTGLRVGLASVQGLGIAGGLPCVGVSTLDVIATVAAGTAERLVVVMDAFRNEVYWAVYGTDRAILAGPGVGALGDILGKVPADAAFVGDTVAKEREQISRAMPQATFPDIDLHLAAPLGRVAIARVASGGAISASELRPLYLRGAAIRPPRA